jgi:hypothetical protein
MLVLALFLLTRLAARDEAEAEPEPTHLDPEATMGK